MARLRSRSPVGLGGISGPKGLLDLGAPGVAAARRRSRDNPKSKQRRLPLRDFGGQGVQGPE
eukprot:4552665-Pyramimonas_sp.AAC.1